MSLKPRFSAFSSCDCRYQNSKRFPAFIAASLDRQFGNLSAVNQMLRLKRLPRQINSHLFMIVIIKRVTAERASPRVIRRMEASAVSTGARDHADDNGEPEGDHLAAASRRTEPATGSNRGRECCDSFVIHMVISSKCADRRSCNQERNAAVTGPVVNGRPTNSTNVSAPQPPPLLRSARGDNRRNVPVAKTSRAEIMR